MTKMYDNSFMNLEDQPSFENDVSGAEAKTLFYKKLKNKDKYSSKVSPYVAF